MKKTTRLFAFLMLGCLFFAWNMPDAEARKNKRSSHRSSHSYQHRERSHHRHVVHSRRSWRRVHRHRRHHSGAYFHVGFPLIEISNYDKDCGCGHHDHHSHNHDCTSSCDDCGY